MPSYRAKAGPFGNDKILGFHAARPSDGFKLKNKHLFWPRSIDLGQDCNRWISGNIRPTGVAAVVQRFLAAET
jgi:hypothetical protein